MRELKPGLKMRLQESDSDKVVYSLVDDEANILMVIVKGPDLDKFLRPQFLTDLSDMPRETRIKQLRGHLGLSQTEFAKACDITQAEVSHLESGRHLPGLETRAKLIEAFELDNVFFERGGHDGHSSDPA